MNVLQNPNLEFHYAGLFSTEGRWIHPERTESTWEIVYVTRGEVYMEEAGREIHALRGQVFLLEPGLMHKGTRHTEGTSFYWVHFRLLRGELPFDARMFDRFEDGYLFRELLHYNGLPDRPTELIGAILVHILCELERASKQTTAHFDAMTEKIYEWIRINADASLSVGDVAAQFGYSVDHLSRICKKHLGISAKSLIDRFLLARAKDLLCNTDAYVKEIAGDLRFRDDKSFIAYFTYHEGHSPSEFRRRFSKLHMNNR